MFKGQQLYTQVYINRDQGYKFEIYVDKYFRVFFNVNFVFLDRPFVIITIYQIDRSVNTNDRCLKFNK